MKRRSSGETESISPCAPCADCHGCGGEYISRDCVGIVALRQQNGQNVPRFWVTRRHHGAESGAMRAQVVVVHSALRLEDILHAKRHPLHTHTQADHGSAALVREGFAG